MEGDDFSWGVGGKVKGFAGEGLKRGVSSTK